MLLIFFTILTSAFLIYSYPNEYQRLIKLDDQGNIVKVVDLISDLHEDLFLRKKKYQPYPIEIPENDYYKVSTDLLEYLENLAKKKQSPLTILLEVGEMGPEKDFAPGLLKKVCSLLHSYRGVSDPIFIVPSDTYRRLAPIIAKKTFPSSITKQEKKDMNLEFTQIDLLANKNIMTIENIDIRNKLSNKWKLNFDNFKKNCFKKLLHSTAYQCFYDFFKLTVPNYEILTNIFKTKNKHVIGYFGGAHWLGVTNILKKDFGFSIYIHIGINHDTFLEFKKKKIKVSLMHTAWDFLKENPQRTLQRGPLVKVYTSDPFSRFNISTTNVKAWKHKLEELLREGTDHYVNFLHSEMKGKTLLEHLMNHGTIEDVNKALRSIREEKKVKALLKSLHSFTYAERQLQLVLSKR